MNAMRWIFAAQGGLVILWPIATAVISAQPTPAAPVIPFPRDYRSWQHVRTIVVGSGHRSFASRGGIHHYYANAKAVEGYRTGRFPNGSVIVDEGVLAEDGTGPSKGILFESDRRSLDVMVKNDRLYKDTDGWGFEHFEESEAKGKLDAGRRTQCYECHSKRKDHDFVFSAIRVAKFAAAAPTASGAPGASVMSAEPAAPAAPAAGQATHSMIAPGDLKWSQTSPGITMAVLSGSPSTEGAHFVIRLKLADGTKVPPHWHPGDEYLTVLSGTFHMGIGEKFDESAATAMTTGAYAMVPKEVRHFGWVTGDTIVQLHGVGPFKTFFVGQSSTK
jgi:quercetin dioxygenase-like cupin family protein